LVVIECIFKADFIGTIFGSWIRTWRRVTGFIDEHLIRKGSLIKESGSVCGFDGYNEVQIARRSCVINWKVEVSKTS